MFKEKIKELQGYTLEYSTLTCVLLLIPTVLIFFLLMSNGYQFCCDAGYYLKAIQGYQTEGLFFKDMHLGYRGYLFPSFYALFPFNLGKNVNLFGVSLAWFSLLSVALFILIEFIVLTVIWRNRFFWVFYIALFLNPFVLLHVPYPLQESFMMMLFAQFVPLIFLAFSNKSEKKLMVFLGLFFGLMYMTRSSEVLLLLPVSLFAFYVIYKSSRNRLLLFSYFILSSLFFIIPQSIISMKYFSSLNPYPKTSVLTSQFMYGNAIAKYGTNLSGQTNLAAGQPYWNPLSCKSMHPKNAWTQRSFDCNLKQSLKVTDLSTIIKYNSWQDILFKSSIHLFNALNYDYLKIYITTKNPSLFSWHQLLSMLIVFFGFYAIFIKYIKKNITSFDFFLDSVLVVTLGVCLFIQVETRFGLLATIVLSIKTVDFALFYRPNGSETMSIIFGAGMFIFMSSLLSIYILSLSGALSS